MEFNGLHPLVEAFPHIELRSGDFLFDIHNAAVLVRLAVDVKSRRVDVEWIVENLLKSVRSGPFRTAHLTLTVAGISELVAAAQFDADPADPIGVDFIEYVPGAGKSGAIRLVFTSSGELVLTGTHCELTYSVLS